MACSACVRADRKRTIFISTLINGCINAVLGFSSQFSFSAILMVQFRQFSQIAVNGTAVNLAAVSYPQPFGKIGAGGPDPPHGHQFRPIPVKAAFTIQSASCFCPEFANTLNLCLRVKCLFSVVHSAVLPFLPRKKRQNID
jgi:hypothetical protein